MKSKRFTDEQIIAVLQGVGGGSKDEGAVPAARNLGADLLQLESEVRGDDGVGGEAASGARGGATSPRFQ